MFEKNGYGYGNFGGHIDIGSSDIAAVIVYGYVDGVGLEAKVINFGEDGSYQASLEDVNKFVPTKDQKELVRYRGWMKVYDDSGVSLRTYADEIIVYVESGIYGTHVTFVFDNPKQS